MNIFEFLKSKGRYSLVTAKYQSYIGLWEQWYKGNVEHFHHYNDFIGDKIVSCERSSFGSAETIAYSWANLIINENFRFDVKNNDNAQKALDNLLNGISFSEQGQKLMEFVFALGTGATVQMLDKGIIKQKYIRANMIYPLSYENGEITECAFASKKNIKGKEYTYIEAHTLDENKEYIIDNFVLKEQDGNVIELTDKFGILPQYKTYSSTPSFQIFKPNVINVYDFNSPMGMSVFGKAIDNLKAVDIVFDSYVNEFVLGIKRIYVGDNAIEWVKDNDGNKTMKANVDSRVIRYMPFDGDIFQQVDFNLRVVEHNKAMQDQLNYLSSKCGLGTNHFKYENGTMTTATEIISTNSEKYKSMRKHQQGFIKPLTDMAKRLLELVGYKNVEIEPIFDDSIIQDTETERANAQREVTEGLRSTYSYLIDSRVGRGMSEAEAKEELQRINDEKTADFTGDNNVFGQTT